MGTVQTADGTEIFYKDWGDGQPIVFHHGWPLSADDWDAQMMFFLQHGYRVIAHDRRGHGRSTQTADGHDMDTYAADAAAVVEHLDLRDAIHIGHSTGGGEVARYVARHGAGRVAKAVLISAVPPLMLKTDENPGGLPIEVFDGFREGTGVQPGAVLPRRRRRAVLRLQPPGRRGLRGRHPELVAPGDDGRRQGPLRGHQGVLGDRLHRRPQGDRRADAGACTATTTRSCRSPTRPSCRSSCSKHGTLKVYPGYPHGMCTTHADVINPDLLEFLKS